WKNDLTENLIWNHGLSQSIRLQNWGNLFFPRPLSEWRADVRKNAASACRNVVSGWNPGNTGIAGRK
ncbi:hypothetical protein, partial [Thiolapillus sp.]|uniref:hypothetical protein n=1 Tax=Thiolapillus sp. TaxID=2017437 RepID=UPI003AF5B011